MNEFALMGVAQGIASMVAQNTNAPLPDVEQFGDSCRFVAETNAGWVRVTVQPVEWSGGQPYTAEPVYGHTDHPDTRPALIPDNIGAMLTDAMVDVALTKAERDIAGALAALLVIRAAQGARDGE